MYTELLYKIWIIYGRDCTIDTNYYITPVQADEKRYKKFGIIYNIYDNIKCYLLTYLLSIIRTCFINLI